LKTKNSIGNRPLIFTMRATHQKFSIPATTQLLGGKKTSHGTSAGVLGVLESADYTSTINSGIYGLKSKYAYLAS
jgi:hypothetical protein